MKKIFKKSAAGFISMAMVCGSIPVTNFSSFLHRMSLTSSAADEEEAEDENKDTVKEIASGKCGETIDWVFDSEGCLSINGEGAIPDYKDTSLVPWNDYREDIKSIIILNDVVSIGENAFSGCTSFSMLSVYSDLLETIGDSAFKGCTSLKKIWLPNTIKIIGNNAFQNCTSLKTITIPASIDYIGEAAFSGCNSVEDVYSYSTAETIEWTADTEAFKAGKATVCHVPEPFIEKYNEKFKDLNLTFAGDIAIKGTCGENAAWEITDTDDNGTFDKLSITGTGIMEDYYVDNDRYGDVDNSVYSPWYGFKNDIHTIDISKDITHIANSAFFGSFYLSELNIQKGSCLESIGTDSFTFCESLSDLIIPASVKTIGEDVFYGCKSISNLTFESGSKLEEIGFRSFYECSSLEKITIPKTVKSMGKCMFFNCYALSDIEFEEGIEIDTIPYATFAYCHALKNVNIPTSVTSIDDFAFFECKSLTDFDLGKNNKLENIGRAAFRLCTNLERVSIPEGVKTIDDDAFDSCYSLASVKFEGNSQLETIDSGAFYECSELKDITIPEGVKYIGDWVFSFCQNLNDIIIPASVTTIGGEAFFGCPQTDVYIYADPAELSWADLDYDDFIYDEENDPDTHCTTICHVPAEYLEGYKSKFSTGNPETDINVTFVADSDTDVTVTTNSTTTTTTTTTTVTTTTNKNVASDRQLCDWSVRDYQKKNDTTDVSAVIKNSSDDKYEIELKDRNGEVLDTYTIDPETGSGTDSSGNDVDLPQTGMSGAHKAVAGLAVLMGITGYALVRKSRRDDQE